MLMLGELENRLLPLWGVSDFDSSFSRHGRGLEIDFFNITSCLSLFAPPLISGGSQKGVELTYDFANRYSDFPYNFLAITL